MDLNEIEWYWWLLFGLSFAAFVVGVYKHYIKENDKYID